MSFVLDASVTVAWWFEDRCTEEAEAVLRSLASEEARVPGHWEVEVSNALLAVEAWGFMAPPEVTRVVRLLEALPIRIEPAQPGRALGPVHRLARTHGLTSYEASYLELAVRGGIPLATLDGRVREAAREEGVVLYRPG